MPSVVSKAYPPHMSRTYLGDHAHAVQMQARVPVLQSCGCWQSQPLLQRF